MSARAVPSVPPRPARSAKPNQETASAGDTPKIPPRPSRRPDRSSSPKHNNYVPSPSKTPPMPAGLDRTTSHESNSLDAPDLPPSESRPSVGQEGIEHDSLKQRQDSGTDDGEQSQQPAELRNITQDLHLHAPKPTIPSTSARNQVQEITGTTAQQADAEADAKVTSPEPTQTGSHEVNDSIRSSAKEGAGKATSAESPEEEFGHIASEKLATPLASPPDAALHPQHYPDELAPSADEYMPRDGASEAQAENEDKDEVPGEDGTGYTQSAISPTPERTSSTHGLESEAHGHRAHPQPGNVNSDLASPKAEVSSPSLTRSASTGEDNEEIHKQVDVEGYKRSFPDDDEEMPEERSTQPTESIQPESPSKDVLEDAPDSLHLEATVTTPDIPQELKSHDDVEAANDDIDPATLVTPQRQSEAETSSYQSESIAVKAEEEPEPLESQKLAAVAQEPQPEDKITSPDVSAPPGVPPRPSKRPSQPSPEDDDSKGTEPSAEIQKPPVAPGPKPQLPARPSRPRKTNPEGEALTKTRSGSSEEVETTKPAVKPKPAVPARPAGAKISNLKTGFLSDLNDRLKLGPKPPPAPEKKDEPEAPPAEKGPLSDARKGRARGPARRRPAAPAAEKETKQATADVPQIKLVDPWSVWRISEDGAVIVQDGVAEPSNFVSSGSASEPAVATKTSSTSEASPENEPSHGGMEGVAHEAPREYNASVDSEAKPEESQSSAVDIQHNSVSGTEAVPEAVSEAEQFLNGKESVEQQQQPQPLEPLEHREPIEPATGPTLDDSSPKISEPITKEDIEDKMTT